MPCLQIERFNIAKISRLYKVIYGYNTISFRIPMVFLKIFWKPILKFIQNVKGHSTVKILKRSKLGCHTLSDFKIYYKIVVQSLSHVWPFATPFTCFSFCSPSFPVSGSISNELILPITWPKYWSFSFSISPLNEYSELTFFKIEWLDLAVQGTIEYSPAPQLESIRSLVLSLLYDQMLTSIHYYQKNHSFDYTDLCHQNDVSDF